MHDTAIYSEKGLRPSQQDTARTIDCRLQSPDGEIHGLAMMVFDGNGSSGNIIARVSCEVAAMHLVEHIACGSFEPQAVKELLAQGLIAANSAAYDIQSELPLSQRSGSTGTIVMLQDNRLFYSYVGDSPLMVVTGGRLYRLIRGHTLAEDAAKGKIPFEESSLYPNPDSTLTRCLGCEQQVRPSAGTFDLKRPGWVIAGSDGALKDPMDLRRIAGILKEVWAGDNASAKRIARVLVKQAIRHGSTDNATVAVIHLPANIPSHPEGDPSRRSCTTPARKAAEQPLLPFPREPEGVNTLQGSGSACPQAVYAKPMENADAV